MRLEITRGGPPDPRRLAALAGAAQVMLAGSGAPQPDRRPAVERSRWRRAAVIENTSPQLGADDTSTPWGGRA